MAKYNKVSNIKVNTKPKNNMAKYNKVSNIMTRYWVLSYGKKIIFGRTPPPKKKKNLTFCV